VVSYVPVLAPAVPKDVPVSTEAAAGKVKVGVDSLALPKAPEPANTFFGSG
jgi:hypothetical protein